MRSNLLIIALLCIFVVIHACGQARNDGPTGRRIGEPLQEAYSAFTGSAGTAFNANEAVFLDESNRNITVFQIEPFAVLAKLDLPESVDAEAFFSGRNNSFFVLKETHGFGVLKRSGEYIRSPVPMYGELTSVSYDGKSQRLVLQDDLDSVGLVVFDDLGNVASSWIGGPVIDGEHAIVAGTLLENGGLIVSLTNGDIARIDFDQTIASGKWEFTTFDIPVPGELLWMSPVFGLEPVLIARTERSIFTIDVNQKKVLDMLTLADGETALHFNRSVGHVIVEGTERKMLVHADLTGKLVKKTIHNVPSQISVDRTVEFSVMDQASGALTVMATHDKQASIYRNRLTDGLFVGVIRVEDFERTIITEGYVIEILDYRLGKAVRKSIARPDETVEITGYNVRHDLHRNGR